MSEQYEYISGSDSGHCCFEASVRNIETEEHLCECFDADDARHIVHCVNNHERLTWLLSQIIQDLPVNRYWLDPEIEREARALLAELEAKQ